MNPNPKLILPGGGHYKSCIDVIEAEGKFTIAGILGVADNKYMKLLGKSLNLPPSNNKLFSHYNTRLM